MAFASGAVSFRRYRITGGKFSTVDDKLLDALNANAFGRYGRGPDENAEVGWITPTHLFDVNFAAEKIAVSRFAHFRMRMDRTSVPGSILRSYVQIEEQAALEAAGREYLTKEERRQAKEAAKARADKEATSGAFRRIAAYPLLLDPENDMLYFGSTGNPANESLGRLFADTFSAKLEPVNTHELAVRAAVINRRQRSLEDLKPDHLVSSPEDINADIYSMDATDRGFLGREFLSWILYRADCGEGTFELDGDTELAVHVDRVVQLKCDFNLTGSTIVRGDGPGQMPETRSALAVGKQPIKMGLVLGGGVGEWSLVLDAVTMDVSNVTLPPAEEDEPQARLEERLENVAELAGLLDALFEKFVQRRLSAEWPRLLGRMKQWASAGRVDLRSSRRRVSA